MSGFIKALILLAKIILIKSVENIPKSVDNKNITDKQLLFDKKILEEQIFDKANKSVKITLITHLIISKI